MNNVSAEYRSSFKCLYSGLFISLYSGKPIFPIVLGGLTVHSLGEVSHMKHLCTFYVRDWDWAAPLGLYSLMNPFLWGKFSLCVSKIHDTGLVMDRPPWDVRNKRIIRKDTFKAIRESPVERVACWIDHNGVASSIELLEWGRTNFRDLGWQENSAKYGFKNGKIRIYKSCYRITKRDQGGIWLQNRL